MRLRRAQWRVDARRRESSYAAQRRAKRFRHSAASRRALHYNRREIAERRKVQADGVASAGATLSMAARLSADIIEQRHIQNRDKKR